MKYTKEFIEEVKRIYPYSGIMIKMAENGDPLLGRYLYKNREGGVPAKFILSHSYKEIVAAAKLVDAQDALYHAWSDGSCIVDSTKMFRKKAPYF